MTTQTFRFVSDESDTDDGDDHAALLKEHTRPQENLEQTKTINTPSFVDVEQAEGQPDNNNENHQQSKVIIKKKKKRKERSKVQIKSVKDGVKQLEKHELIKKRRVILYQLAATAVIAMLHGLSVVPNFWNSILLNIYDLNTHTVTLWCLFGSGLVSCLVTPAILKRFPLKWILCSGSVAATLFSAARFYPKLYLVIPASVLLGLSLAPFYTTVFSHISKLAIQYEGYRGKPYRETVVTFTAVCLGILSCAPLLLSLFRVIILNVIDNASHPPLKPTTSECGFNFLWNWMDKAKAQNGLSPELYEIQAILGACLVCTLGSIVLTFVVLEEYHLPSHMMSAGEQPHQEVAAWFEQLKDANHILLFPIAVAMGMFETFCYTLYGQAFVACNFGPDTIFYIVLCMSIAAVLSSIGSAHLLPRFASIKIVVPAYVLALICLMVAILGGYMPYGLFYVLAALCGAVNYILVTQVTAFILLHFMTKLEVSLSVFHCGKAIAYLLTFTLVRYHGDNSTATGAVLATLLIGLVCQVVLELRVRLQPPGGEHCVGESVGAYVLLESSRKAPWLPSVDPTTVDTDYVESMMARLPSKEEDDKCNTQ